MNYSYKIKEMIVICALLVLSGIFLYSVNKNWDTIFKKVLTGHDQHLNFTVSANVTRQFFPPMVRVNPFVETIENWTEGPYWQHIPPLFVYVPLPLFIIDGQITIETIRFSYLLLILFGGYLLIGGIYYLGLSYRTIVAATIASAFVITNKFSWQIISGYGFGVSDILLEFTVIASFVAISSYIIRSKSERKLFSTRSIILITIITTLPLLVKNVLGAIPLATFLIIILYDERKFNKRIIFACLSSSLLIIVHYGLLFLSSRQTFIQEIVVPFKHFDNFENWARPWHAFLSDYLPHRYLGDLFPYYIVAICIGIIFIILMKNKIEYKSLRIISLAIIWFIANLVAVSLVTSKVPGSIYQTFILSLFFIFSIIFEILIQIPYWKKINKKILIFYSKHRKLIYHFYGSITIIVLIVVGVYAIKTFVKIKVTRFTPYNYVSQEENFYQFAEIARNEGIDKRDIVIFKATSNDLWFRYYVIFLTGAESRKFSEVVSKYQVSNFQKYRNVYFVINRLNADVFSTLSSFGQIQQFGEFTVIRVPSSSQYIENIFNFLSVSVN